MKVKKSVVVDGVEYVQKDSVAERNYSGEWEGLESLIGMKTFIRTVTYHCTGRIVGIKDGFIKLEDSAWIADSGRFAGALKTGVLDEVEPTKQMWVSVSSIVDFFEWKHDLPLEQK